MSQRILIIILPPRAILYRAAALPWTENEARRVDDISTYTTPLSGCVRNGHPFEWTPLLEKCFESIKTLACKAPILKPIDYDNPDPLWVITDGSKAGVGAVYGQGPDWKTC